MFDLLDRLKRWFIDLVKSRVFVLMLVFIVLSTILIQRVFVLQIVNGQAYLDDYKLQIQKTKEVQGTRGRILDRNGVVLADNKLAYSVTIEDNGDYDTVKEKNKIINATIEKVISIVESNGDSIVNDFKIILNDNGEYAYSMTSEVQRLRFLADVFGKATIDKLSNKQKAYSAADLMHYLCTDETYGYGLDEQKLSKEEILKLVTIRYSMGLNRYQKYVATTIASDVSESTTAAIMENLDTLQGVNIEEDSIRYYPDSKYFASILGYTGVISQDEYDALDEKESDSYSLTDVVGKAGLEQTLDKTLQCEKGEIKLYVNSVGKVIESKQGKKAKAGNDVYLSIDANLQKAAYDLLEEKLAGIILSNLTTSLTYDRTQAEEGSDVKIPIGDVYNAFISNEILNVGHFEAADAGETEKSVYASFSSKKEAVLADVMAQLSDSGAPAYKDCDEDMQAYLSYIISTVLTQNAAIIQKDSIDTNDSTYIAWENDESISLYTYLNYAISKNWIDTSKLTDYMNSDSEYSDQNEVYQGILAYISANLPKDSGFDKLIYKYMIRNEEITGSQIGMMLYEQGILNYDADVYNKLADGTMTAYDFMYSKIEDLEITPGQLGLEPSTGSVVVTDTKTGQLLACVSYPGYDNNRLANTMDSGYYTKLLNDQSAPLYNNATQEKTAPGSTYKPLVAVAGLTEDVIDTSTYISCGGLYEKISPSPRCWIYPGSHGSLNVTSAIQHSCNMFFYEVGYRLGLTNQMLSNAKSSESGYSSDQGCETLLKYATMFGLNQTTGIEIPESSPQVSDQDSVRSAIGQGTNNYTTTQLARYVTAIANRGTVYNLSLLDHVENKDGKVTKTYEPDVLNQIEGVSGNTWDAVQSGMRAVVTSNSTYSSLGNITMSGKTGTAQQSTTHPDHGLFVGYAPSDDPEVAFAIRIKNGYESLYPSEIGRDLMRYYYGETSRDELITGHASAAGSSSTHGD